MGQGSGPEVASNDVSSGQDVDEFFGDRCREPPAVRFSTRTAIDVEDIHPNMLRRGDAMRPADLGIRYKPTAILAGRVYLHCSIFLHDRRARSPDANSRRCSARPYLWVTTGAACIAAFAAVRLRGP